MALIRTILTLFFLSIAVRADASCTLLMANPSGFGDSDGLTNINIMQLGDLQLECDSSFQLGLGGGQNFSGARRLSDGAGHFISYFLWKDSGAGSEWGDNGMNTASPYPADPLSGTGTGSPTVFPVFGTAQTAGAFPPGSYSDIVHVILAWPPYGSGDSSETDLFITLNLTGNCTLDVSGLSGFGEWPSNSPNLEGIALGAVTVNCTPGLNFAVGMNAGMNFQGGIRNMRNGTELIPYILWADAGRSLPWGDNGLSLIEPLYAETYPAPAQTGTGAGTSQSFFVWGDAMINGFPAGTYSDTVGVSVVWP